MSLWQRLRARFQRPPEAPREAAPVVAPAPTSPPSAPPAALERDDEIASLARVGEPGGPTVELAIAILRRARGTVREADAVALTLRSAAERQLPEPLRVACADVLAARGEAREALALLEGVSSSAGLVLAADLYASAGQLARAVGTIERLLSRDIDAPGARERHRRWRASLGYADAPTRRLDEATMVAATPSKTSFRLLREVARGGAGTVYEAEDELLGRRVAFKVYHRGAADRAVVQREARLAASLAGPGVVRVFDASPDEGWIALEWVGRGSIRDLLRSGDLRALHPVGRWARPLALALSRVHAAGIVHADVKPANVLIRQPGDAVLGDFGIARSRGASGEGGSAGYVSPERLAGRSSDPRDDVYGFGRVLEDVLHRFEAHGGVSDERLTIEPSWQALMLRCVGVDADRPADAQALVEALP